MALLISHRLRPIAYSNQNEAYIDALFARFCQIRTDEIVLDLDKIFAFCATNQWANSFCRNFLISSTQKKNVFVLKVHNFVELFHQTPSIGIKNCCLNAIMFELIVQSLKLQQNKLFLESIEFSNINEEKSELTMDEVVYKYADKFDEIAWSISKTEFGEIKLFKLQFIELGPKCELSVTIFNSAFYQTDLAEEIKTTYGIYQIKVVNECVNKKRKKEKKEWIVDKRYSDFLKLHKYFTKKRDGIRTIDISAVRFPPKTLFRKPNTNNVMETRRQLFEVYIRYLLITSHRHKNNMYLKALSHFLAPQGYDYSTDSE